MKITIPIIPTAQMRARHGTAGGFSRTYKDKKQVCNERTLEAFLKDYVPEKPMSGPIKLSIIANMPIPKSTSKKMRERMLCGEERPTKKPDSSNIAKQLEDACTRLQFWQDDKQITNLSVEKKYDRFGSWEIEITEIY